MKIREGFQIENPNFFIPWDIKECEIVAALTPMGLCKVADGYYFLQCVSICGLKHQLGIHFNISKEAQQKELDEYINSIGAIRIKHHILPQFRKLKDEQLFKLEFFGVGSNSLQESFDIIQKHLIQTFGRPWWSLLQLSRYPNYTWHYRGVRIYHYIHERFGPEEIAIIVKT